MIITPLPNFKSFRDEVRVALSRTALYALGPGYFIASPRSERLVTPFFAGVYISTPRTIASC